MSVRINLLGKTINGIKIIKQRTTKRWSSIDYDCECYCGTTFISDATSINRGKTKSCGCKKREFTQNAIDKYLGKSFNDWTIKEFRGWKLFDNQSHKMWLCECSCGTEKEIIHSNVVYGKSKSCGCWRNKITAVSNRVFRKNAGESTFRHLLNCYKQRAKNNKKEFSLTEEKFRELTKMNCFYCNKPPSNRWSVKSVDKEWQELNTYIYSGIDRINSKSGYAESNCVPCCKVCNQVKMDTSIEEFFETVKNIYSHSIVSKNK